MNNEKALLACMNYDKLMIEINFLSDLIVESLRNCPMIDPQEDFKNQNSHLKSAFRHEINEEGDRYYLSPQNQIEELDVCIFCQAAYNAIQKRKKARMKLGVVKRAIRQIGRKAVV